MARSIRRRRLGRLVGHQVLHVLEREADRVQALDDPIVQVAPDPLALLHDGERRESVVQAGVLHGDAGVAGEELDDPLVGRVELGPAALVGHVQVADGSAMHGDRHAEERVIGRMVRREAVRSRVRRDLRDPDRAPLVDDQAQQPVALRQRPDPLALLGA